MEVVLTAIGVLTVICLFDRILARNAFRRLEYDCSFSKNRVCEGEELFLVETVTNRKRLPVPWLKVDIRLSRWLQIAGMRSVITQDTRHFTSSFVLKGLQKTTRCWTLKCLKRGYYTIGSVSLLSGGVATGDHISEAKPVNAGIIVYPAAIDMDKYFLPLNIRMGDRIVQRWIIDDPFLVAGIREYTPSDPLCKVHWPSTARHGEIMVRNNAYSSDQKICIIFNVQSIEVEHSVTVDPPMIELGIKTAAALIETAVKAGMPFMLASNGSIAGDDGQMVMTGASSGRDHGMALMEVLAKLELTGRRNFDKYFDEITLGISNTDVLLITAYVNEGIARVINRLGSGNNHVSLFILDPFAQTAFLPKDVPVYFVRKDAVPIEGASKEQPA